MENGEEKKGFTIRDRRTATQPTETGKEEQKKTEGPSAGGGPGKAENEGRERRPEEELHLAEINFSSFILSLSTSALMHLGEVPDPITQKVDKSLPLAKQSIDLLGMLSEKTRGNLTPDEEKLIDHLLTDLRWRYIRAAKG
jgi:Domain of unknown function (DUF1844)